MSEARDEAPSSRGPRVGGGRGIGSEDTYAARERTALGEAARERAAREGGPVSAEPPSQSGVHSTDALQRDAFTREALRRMAQQRPAASEPAGKAAPNAAAASPFRDEEITVRQPQPARMVESARDLHAEDTLVVHVAKILADADRQLDLLSSEISVVAPLPSAPPPPVPARREAVLGGSEGAPPPSPSSATGPGARQAVAAPTLPHEPAPGPMLGAAHGAPLGAALGPLGRARAAAPSLPARPRTLRWLRASLVPGAAGLLAVLCITQVLSRAPHTPAQAAVQAVAAPAEAPSSASQSLPPGPRAAQSEPPPSLLEAFRTADAAPAEPMPISWLEAGRRALREGDAARARTLLQHASEHDAMSPHPWAGLAEAELALGAPEAALPAAQAAAKLRPKRTRYHQLLARIYDALGRTDEAREARALAELLAPYDPDLRAAQRAREAALRRASTAGAAQAASATHP